MSVADTAVIVSAILGSGGIGALVMWRQDRRRAPIEKTTAVEATERLRSEIRSADIDGLRDIITSLREDQEQSRRDITDLRDRVERAEARAAVAEDRATQAERRAAEDAAYIDVLISHWPSPPPPPRPTLRGPT
ncbi:hypothetical protein MF406_14125 [Georgenia sp. TF02-10]|uniref:hypothetical protein n=1 Tax=Georgenia sp. TF02-10 TaxID=2917725 RepID=UPI001FA72323|nr:hypothetical protein [Georgenia sp. TF02-10]UNX54070.1 hypothetical protein MF406_14125 [Georgenia sp. TF02-10]